MNKQNSLVPELWNILEVKKENAACYSLRLETPQGYEFQPGQFNMLYLFGMGEVPISISSNPAVKGELIHSIHAVGTVTKAMQKLKAGDQIGVRGPYGTSWPLPVAEKKQDILLVAGGIGIAPLRPLIYQILEQRASYNQVHLLYGARTPKDFIFNDQIGEEKLKGGEEGINLQTIVDRPLPNWTGHVGVVPKLISTLEFDPENTQAFLCGPEIMMRFSIEPLLGLGVPKENIHLSLERNMKCAKGFCGHCQMGPFFICKDGPVFNYPAVEPFLHIRGV